MTAMRRAAERSRVSLTGAAGLAILGLFLAWQIMRNNLAAALVDRAPRVALALASNQSDALIRVADEQLGLKPPTDGGETVKLPESEAERARKAEIAAKGIPLPMVSPSLTPEARADLRRQAGAAALANPLNARAIRIYGQLAETEAETRDWMQRVSQRTRHEVLSNYWLLQQGVLDGDFPNAAKYADILMRSQPQLAGFVVPIMARIAESPKGDESVKALLRMNPPWRWHFFNALATSVSDLRTPLNLMLDMQRGGVDPTVDELGVYIARLMDKKRYELAYYAWLQFLTPEKLAGQSLLFNGKFAFPPSGLPFDWTFVHGGGLRIEIVDRPEAPRERALMLEFVEGKLTASGVKQVVTLAAGAYRFAGSRSGSVQARRGFRWRVSCLESPSVNLGESEPIVGNLGGWKEFNFRFAVPNANCRAQRVSLELDAISDSDRLVSGSAWFADLSLSVAQ